MGLTEKQVRRFNKIADFDKQHPNEYCWADLFSMAMEEDREMRKEHKDSAKSLYFCEKDLKNNGSCWCGKFKSDNA